VMLQQQLRRVGCMSRDIRCKSLGAAHAPTATSKLM
jgi:hypothetical protein